MIQLTHLIQAKLQGLALWREGLCWKKHDEHIEHFFCLKVEYVPCSWVAHMYKGHTYTVKANNHSSSILSFETLFSFRKGKAAIAGTLIVSQRFYHFNLQQIIIKKLCSHRFGSMNTSVTTTVLLATPNPGTTATSANESKSERSSVANRSDGLSRMSTQWFRFQRISEIRRVLTRRRRKTMKKQKTD